MRNCITALLAFCFFMELPSDIAWAQSSPAKEPAKQSSSVNLADLDPFIEQVMREWKVPGLAIAVVQEGQVILAKGYGHRDVEKQLPVTSQTLFAIGSITKSITVTGLGMLVDDGKLDWDKPVRTYLPDFQLHDKIATEQMTARDLVTHRSGLPRHDFVWYGDSNVSRQELFRRLRFLEPSKEFRSTWQYQNLMYLTAGILTERLSGSSWEDFTRQRIIEPLGMQQVNFSVSESQKSDNFAQPYAKFKDEVRPVPFHNLDAVGPAGSINANVEAMIRYVDFHIQQGKLQGQQLLSPAEASQMRSPQMVMPTSTQSPQHDELGDLSYGMGFMVSMYRGTRFVEHGGGIDGFASLMTFLPRKKAGVIVLTNLSGVNPVPTIINRRVCDLVLGLEPVDWSGRIRAQQLKNLLTAAAAKNKNTSDRKEGTSPSHALADYAGRYQHPAYGIMSIECAEKTLKLAAPGGLQASLQHYHYDVFENEEDPTGRFDQRKVTFSYDKRGEIDRVAISFEPAVSDIIFVRLPDESMKQKKFLGPLAGSYRLGPQTLSVALKNDHTLVLTVPGQPSYELVPVRNTLFDLKGLTGYSATFRKDTNGRVAEVVLHQPNGTFQAKRIMPPQQATGPTPYSKPPQNVLEILNAPPSPSVSISPTRAHLLLVHSIAYPPVADLAEPMLGLAGIRMNPRTNGPHRPPQNVGLTLQEIPHGMPRSLAVPKNARLGFPRWSPDGQRFAFTNTLDDGIELWIGNAKTGELKCVPDLRLNLSYGDPPRWMPDSQSLLCHAIAADRAKPPSAPRVPPGPTVSESLGKKGSVRTFQDLLQNSHDEDLFDYFARSQLVIYHVTDSRATRVGAPEVIMSAEPSPDGNHILVVRNHRPYSYLHTAFAFPKEIEVWDRTGKVEHTLASLPLADQVPIEGVPTGPRRVHWRPTQPATLVWVEALDEGDPKKKVPHRDVVRMLKSPFQGDAQELAKVEHRLSDVTWGERNGVLLLQEYDRDRKWSRTFLVDADQPGQPARLIWDRSVHDRYRDPGNPVMRVLPTGQTVLWQQDDFIYLIGEGASEHGDRPFLDRYNLVSSKSERMFQCEDKTYESVVGLIADDASKFITRRETTEDPPNYFWRSADGKEKHALTNFPDPAPQLRGVKKELVTYHRKDGVQLSFTLYLPANYQAGQALPTVVWAYPREYADADTAGQVSGSPYRFTRINGTSHLFFLTQGYAVLDAATMPVVGDPETVNNTYIEQIVASAQAAIDKAVEMGVTDRHRVGVAGHSYGAFMTANLLAHSNLFRAGIARSGAYNRTLTPFGFQSERRTLWEAPETYHKVSPFMHAHRINEPILLLHGAADDNPGTFPIQSDRLYQAIRGNGGHVRYVSLPYEAHGYIAQESVEHTLYEMISWFDKYVKNAPLPQPVAAESQE